MQNEKMDRGTDAMKAHLGGTDKMNIRQTRRGWLQEYVEIDTHSFLLRTGDWLVLTVGFSLFVFQVFGM